MKNLKFIRGIASILSAQLYALSISPKSHASTVSNYNTSFNTNLTNNTSYSTTNNYNSHSYTTNNINVDTESESSKQKRTKEKSNSYLRGQATRANAQLASSMAQGGTALGIAIYESYSSNDPTWKKVAKIAGMVVCATLTFGVLGFSFYLSWKNASAPT